VFFDRLDEPILRFAADVAQGDVEPVVPALGQTWDTRVLVPPQAWGNGYDLPSGKAKLIGHMRNRVYLPRLMRFAQRDPNATGQLVMAAVSHSGGTMDGSIEPLRIETLYGDGPSLYGYLSGRPRGRSDPLGLNGPIESVPDEYTGEDAFNDFSDAMGLASPLLGPADFIRGALSSLVEEYAANQEWDVEWAMDWSMPDDAHTRGDNKWVVAAIGRGLYGAFDIGIPFTGGSTVNPLDVLAAGGKGAGGARGSPRSSGRAAKGLTTAASKAMAAANKRPNLTYGEGRKYTAGHNHAIQAHKIVEWRHYRNSTIDINDMPATVLTRDQHLNVSRRLRTEMPFGRKYFKSDLVRAYTKVYTDMKRPDLVKRTKKFFDRN